MAENIIAGNDSVFKSNLPMEIIHGIAFDKSGIIFQVTSTGETGKEYFEFKTDEDSDYLKIIINRVKRDEGKKMPFVTEVSYSFEELGIEERPIIIGNPISKGPNLV